MVTFPIVGHRKILENIDALNKPEVVQRYGVYYTDNRTNTKWRALYNIIFLQRRFMSVFVLVYLEKLPFFQTTLLMVFSTCNFIYIVVNYPLKTLEENRIEVFNEGSILTCCHLMTTFLNVAIPIDFKDQLGYVLIGVATLNIAVNLSLVVHNSIY